MALSESTRQQLRLVMRHPVQWMRGDGLPEESVRPWEQAVQIVPNLLVGLRNGFIQSTMYLYQNVFKVDKRQQTVANLALGIWDGLNDPIIGAYMDTKSWSINVHRWICRICLVGSNICRLIPMFDLGLTPWQRIIMFIVARSIGDVFGTPWGVSGTKLVAHITPHSKQRQKIAWAQGLGLTIHEMVLPLYLMFIGLRDIFGWSEYAIYIVGAVALTIPSTILELGPTFVIQRVPDKVQPTVTMEEGLRGFYLEMKESFSVMRHNKYFILNTLAKFLGVFTPSVSDNDFYRYCGVDKVINTASGRLKGEFLLWFRDNIVSTPCNLIVPFALPIIKRFGGPRNMQVFYEGIRTVCNTAKWVVGMKTPAGVFFNWGMETINRTFGRVNTISENIIKFEMLDYVEYMTGRRTEGVYMAVDGIITKFVLNNIDMTIGNLVIDGLGFRPDLENHQPARFYRWAPTLNMLVPAIDASFVFIARLLYKYPADLRDKVEAELIERRRLAQEVEEEATV